MMIEYVPALYQHTRRPEWGLAVLAWERDGKRAYLFESGMLKVLAEPFFGLMKRSADAGDNAEAIVQRLARQLGSGETGKVLARGAAVFHFTLEDQLALFSGEYAGGFVGNDWQEKLRGTEGQRRLKRHKNPAIDEARIRLSKEQIEHWLAKGNYAEAWETVAQILDATDLVPSSQVKALGRRSRVTEHSVEALRNLLYGEAEFAVCFDEFVKVIRQLFGASPSWEVPTALLALVHPEVHVCIRRNSFQKLADWRMLNLGTTTRPSSGAYLAFLDLATAVFEELKQAGTEPQDLLDVHDFLKLTTSPVAQRRMHAVKHAIARANESRPSQVPQA